LFHLPGKQFAPSQNSGGLFCPLRDWLRLLAPLVSTPDEFFALFD
jgi:hypothetical protein